MLNHPPLCQFQPTGVPRNFSLGTFTGKKFRPFDPDPETINIDDIMHALANQPMYLGHTMEFYSKAQHCVLVAENCHPEHALHGLLHHAADAYLPALDCRIWGRKFSKPLVRAAKHLQRLIYRKFGLKPGYHNCVIRAEGVVSATERRDMLQFPTAFLARYRDHANLESQVDPLPRVIQAWSPTMAERKFFVMFHRLTHASPAKIGGAPRET
jgi:hypothetical protein